MTGFDSTSDKPDNNGIEKCCVQEIPQGILEKPDPMALRLIRPLGPEVQSLKGVIL